MWHLSSSAPSYTLYVGAHTVQVWQAARDGMVLVGQSDASARHAQPGLGAFDDVDIQSLMQRVDSALHNAAQAMNGQKLDRCSCVVESSWAPIVHLDCGNKLWTVAQLEQWTRYRLSLLFGQQSLSWPVCFSYVAGDRATMAAGLPSSIADTLHGGLQRHGLMLDSLQPAFCWGHDWLMLERHPHAGWWYWLEQDRGLLAWCGNHHIEAFNPAVEPCLSHRDLKNLCRLEAKRLGVVDNDGTILAGAWSRQAMPQGSSQLAAPNLPHDSPDPWIFAVENRKSKAFTLQSIELKNVA